MKRIAWAVLLVFFANLASAAESKPQYFTNVREVRVPPSAQQTYFVIDEEIWGHARADLGDLRLYNGAAAVPYALRVMGNVEYTEQRPVKVLNKGAVPDATQFVVDMSGVDEYDQITLRISKHDFNRTARVEGANAADASAWTLLTSAPIFDFSKQRLGSNLTIALPESNFRFLRVSISGKGADRGNDVLPADIGGATASNTLRSAAVWDSIPTGEISHDVKTPNSVMRFDVPKSVPVDRIAFAIPAEHVNFRRDVSVDIRDDEKRYASDEEGWRTIVNGVLSRVRTLGGGVHEELTVATFGTRAAHWRVTVRNGDDIPLPIEMTPQSLERRVYFDPRGATSVKLFYGDEKLAAPEYDYAKFFRDAEAKSATPAVLEAGMHNPEYTGRPDERPWTERHNWVLWAALVVAVLGIGAVALRGLRNA